MSTSRAVAALPAFWLRIALRSGRLFAPFAAAIAALAFIHSGGASDPRPAYATAAALLFPIQVWVAQQAVNAVPTEIRRVVLVAAGSRRRLLRGVLAASAGPNLAVALVAVVWPWLSGAIPPPTNGAALLDVTFGTVATLALVPAATALGLLTSEVAVGSRAQSAVAGAFAVLASLLLGFGPPVVAWLGPPLVGLARLGGSISPTPQHLAVVVLHSCAWSLIAVALGERWLARRW